MMKYFAVVLALCALTLGAEANNDLRFGVNVLDFKNNGDSIKKSKSFYEYKNAGKQIDKISKMLVADSVTFSYGIQSYRKYQIKSATCFYNQPTDLLYYILLADNGHSFHFEIPIDNIAEVTIIAGSPRLIELQMEPTSPTFIKEYTKRSGLLFSLGYTVVQIPISDKVSTNALLKQMTILKKKAIKYNSSK